MSRAVSYGSLLAASAALFVVACGKGEDERAVNTRGSVNIVFNCAGNNVTLRLDGDDGGPAWKVERRQGDAIGWKVQRHVQINSIKLKDGGAIPVNVTQPKEFFRLKRLP